MIERSLDNHLQLVADRNRRRVIQYLRQKTNGHTTIDDLIDALHNVSSVTDESTDRAQLAIQLYHAHLPKLSDGGVVDFDPENGVVRYQPDGLMETVLDSLPDGLSLARP